ncbi:MULTISPECIES: DMT family transporter [Glaesserella]|uniref:EamA family transporter n=1 Tax=Glaesserella australis TaxID=2094024 RepID=A0A328BZN2_9PAST|nr:MULTISPECIES: DMT family transporter [Glaesserella]AUI66927.1 EamA family transporter [Glaesserella sp. 15-184]RAL19509.1 EamA family transporter [Glaesserella australis]
MQQRPLLGFSLALLAAMTWGALPIAAQKVLSIMNAQTLVWIRFVVAGIGLLLILGLTKKLPKPTAFTPRFLWLIGLGVLGLSLNFFLFSYGLNFISPTTSQVLWQLAPFTMILCGIVIFKEKFGLHQKIGLGLLVIGLIAFFNDRFGEIFQFGTYAFGILVGSGAAIVWVAYGIAQKLMLAKFSSQQILLIIYIGCAVLLAPFASPTEIGEFDGFLLGCFIFCCLNTLIGYGAYAEALNHWDASKVSVVTILLPIFTMIFSSIGHWLFPDTFASPDMNLLSYIGALIVVSGTILSAVGHKLFKRK